MKNDSCPMSRAVQPGLLVGALLSAGRQAHAQYGDQYPETAIRSTGPAIGTQNALKRAGTPEKLRRLLQGVGPRAWAS